MGHVDPGNPQGQDFTDPTRPESRDRRGLERDTSQFGKPPAPISTIIGRVLLAILGIVFIVFAVLNVQNVSFNYIFGESERTALPNGELTGGVPLILLLVGSFLVGIIFGSFMSWRRRRVKASRLAREAAFLRDG